MLKNSTHNSTLPTLLPALLTTLLISLLLLAGCGINPDDPVYDTVNNPDNFPDLAVSLVENIQSGKFEELDVIVDAFSGLYSENPDLLGNDKWKEVVLKLGIKLRYKADQLAKEGIESYTKAAGLYHVAAFARPNDPRLEAIDKLFSVWKGEAADSLVSLDSSARSGKTDQGAIIEAEIEQLKRFQFADSLSTEFASLYLHDLLFGRLSSDRDRMNAIIDSLSRSEKAFLNSIGAGNQSIETTLGQFENPTIDLVAVDLIKLSGNEYRAEVYFRPRESVNNDLIVAFWVDSPDSLPDGQTANASYFPYDITPVGASSKWKIDQVSVAYRTFSFNWPISAVSVGLYSQSDNEVRFLPIVSGINSSMETDSSTYEKSDKSARGPGNLIRVTLESDPDN